MEEIKGFKTENITVNPDYFHNFLRISTQILAEVATYNWDSEFKMKEIKERFGKVCKSMAKEIDWSKLTENDCDNLHFGRWTSEEDLNDFEIPALEDKYNTGKISKEDYEKEMKALLLTARLRLIPFYLVDMIPDGLEVTDINGDTFKFKRQGTDLDIRFGMLAYGIIPK